MCWNFKHLYYMSKKLNIARNIFTQTQTIDIQQLTCNILFKKEALSMFDENLQRLARIFEESVGQPFFLHYRRF